MEDCQMGAWLVSFGVTSKENQKPAARFKQLGQEEIDKSKPCTRVEVPALLAIHPPNQRSRENADK